MCDTMVSVTDDGVLFAKNSDRDPNESQYLHWIPARDHPTGGADASTRAYCTWIDIPQVARTHAVLLSRPWWMFGAEIGANAHGVVIGNEAVFTRELKQRARRGDDAPGLLGMDLLRLALERAATASDAVEVIVGLLESYGQSGPCSSARPRFTYDNSFIVADPDGAIVLETAGRSHATEVVTHGGRSISNGLTIPGFAEAHADRLRGRVSACAVRQARTHAAAEDAVGRSGAGAVVRLMWALRDHGPSGVPHWSLHNGALSAPCAHAGGVLTATQSTASWVADLRPAARSRHWVTATSAPCTSLFKPVRVDEPVDLGPVPKDRFDAATLWWGHEVLHRASMLDPLRLLSRYSAERDAVEAAWVVDPPTGSAAFEEAAALEARWAADVVGAAQPETRPLFVRRHWAGRDKAAGVPTGPGATSSRYMPALAALNRAIAHPGAR